MPRVLGISASLRNARVGLGSEQLVRDVRGIGTAEQLRAFIDGQTRLRADAFLKEGSEEGKDFDQMCAALRRLSSAQGLSNSEAALAAGLWGAAQEGAEIDHVSLASHFPPTGKIRSPEILKQKILAADALLLSGPVYFGDRGSLAQSFVEFCASDPEVLSHLAGKAYGGLAVGAKRNGGQETTLVYQMFDMVNMSMLAVGNSGTTTAQYGGTAVAGDIGTFSTDEYGFNTCVSTGARVGYVASLLERGQGHRMKGKIRVHMWLLQDHADKRGLAHFERWRQELSAVRDDVEFTLWDISSAEIMRCLACDLCPTESGPRERYRCVVSSEKDFFVRNHAELVKADAILMCAYSPADRSSVTSVYQTFMERTRYIRRDNYLFGDMLVAPFVISELTARQNLNLRMMTSIVRHQTVVHHPIIGMKYKGEILNWDDLLKYGAAFVGNARKLIAGQLARGRVVNRYAPLGYHISKAKSERDRDSDTTHAGMEPCHDSVMTRWLENLRLESVDEPQQRD